MYLGAWMLLALVALFLARRMTGSIESETTAM